MEINNQASELTEGELDDYLEEIDKYKNTFGELVKNMDGIDEGFVFLRTLALKTEYLKTQCQMLCMKKQIPL